MGCRGDGGRGEGGEGEGGGGVGGGGIKAAAEKAAAEKVAAEKVAAEKEAAEKKAAEKKAVAKQVAAEKAAAEKAAVKAAVVKTGGDFVATMRNARPRKHCGSAARPSPIQVPEGATGVHTEAPLRNPALRRNKISESAHLGGGAWPLSRLRLNVKGTQFRATRAASGKLKPERGWREVK